MSRRRWVTLVVILISLVGASAIGWRLYLDHEVYETNVADHPHLGAMPSPERGQRILIFAPHEDDEALGCAGFIQKAVAAGADVHVVAMTNGEFPEIDVFLFEETILTRPAQFIRLGYMRQKETLAALSLLGVKPDAVTFLGYPNQYLNQMWLPEHWLPSDPVTSRRTRSSKSPYNNSLTPGAVYCGQSMLQDVEAVLTRFRPDVVITLHPNDIHVDHWPTYTVVEFALRELAERSEEFARKCRVYTYLIHRNQWPAPRRYRPKQQLLPPEGLIRNKATDWLTLPLSKTEETNKGRAVGMYRTQGGKIDPLLRSFIRTNDLFGAVPVHEWPSGPDVPSTVVIHDSLGDTYAAVADPHVDINTVSLKLQNGMMSAEIKTCWSVDPSTTYHLSIHASGPAHEDRIIAEYSWQGTQITGWLVEGGSLRKISSSAMKADYGGDTATLHAAWPLAGGKDSFFMVRAWANRGRRLVDQTAAETFVIQGTR